MRKKRRSFETFGLSFLDVVSCSFGAIILLLVISKISQPFTLETMTIDLTGHIEKLETELEILRGETTVYEKENRSIEEQLSISRSALARLQQSLSDARSQYETAQLNDKAKETIEGQLASAKQSLSEEMQRLLGANYRRSDKDNVIGGIPVDSEYIIFIIDTSGSMREYACAILPDIMDQVLTIYPKVKGLQVLNDMGTHMFSQYRNQWISDTPARRKAIVRRLQNWAPFSNSSPAEGIHEAIKRYFDKGNNISIYYFGDDFSGYSIQSVIDQVTRLNRQASGKNRLRIHTVGFPVLFASGQGDPVRMSALMRKLAENNNGSFVGLNHKLKPCR